MDSSEIIKTFNWRYATKAFTDKPVAQSDIETLAEALRLSPSSFGLQPWKFVIVQNKELQEKLVPHSWNQGQVAQASALFVLCRPKEVTNEDVDRFIASTAATRGMKAEDLSGYADMMKGFLSQYSEEDKKNWMEKQVYIALANLLTTAALLKIDACPMEGFIADKYAAELGLDDMGIVPVVVCPVGYRDESDKYATAPKVRYSTEETIIYIK